MATTSKVSFTFEILNADGSERTLELAQDMVKIGKHPSSHLLIDAEGVARMHAYIETLANGEVVIMDLGSVGGTFVNGEKLTKKRVLATGDRIEVGGTTIVAWLDGAKGASAVSAPRPAAKPVAKPVEAAKPTVVANPFAATASAFAAPIAVASSRAKNPFAAPVAAKPEAQKPVVDTDARGEGYYAIVANGPALAVGAVESTVPAIEVMVLWGERDILHVSHLSPPRAFVVGEALEGGKESPDFSMESAFLGSDQMTVATPEGNGVAVLVPNGATIKVRRGADERSDAALRGSGELRASTTSPGALQYTLREDETARVSFKGFVFQVKAVQAAAVTATRVRPDATPFYYVGGVGTLFAGLFTLLSFLNPPQSSLGGETLDLSNRYVQAMIQRREEPAQRVQPQSGEQSSATSGGAASGDPGEMGARNQPHTDRRSATAGHEANTSNIPPTSAQDAAQTNVVTNAVATIAAMFAAGPTSEFSTDNALGSDPMSVLGNLVGGIPGSSGGMGGLAPGGTGVGGGGDNPGTYGFTNGIRTVGSDYVTRHSNGDLTERGPVDPHVTVLRTTAVTGGLTGDQIRRVIQRNVSQVQHCYEQGLQRNPSLQGRVTVSFIISAAGAVSGSSVADNSVGDSAVGSCVASAVRRWAFPQPDPAGPVSVRFPFNFTRGQ